MRVDGVPLTQLSQAGYRNQIAAVMQDDQLLSGSIRDNITFFADEPNDDWAQECAKLAAVHEDISRMPMGYHSLIGDMGSALVWWAETTNSTGAGFVPAAEDFVFG